MKEISYFHVGKWPLPYLFSLKNIFFVVTQIIFYVTRNGDKINMCFLRPSLPTTFLIENNDVDNNLQRAVFPISIDKLQNSISVYTVSESVASYYNCISVGSYLGGRSL